MDPVLKSALQARVIRWFAAVQLDLWTGEPLRLLNGDGVVDIGLDTFVGTDATYGTLDEMEAISDGSDDQAPLIKVTVLARDNDAVDVLLDPQMQACPARIWVGAVDPITGHCVGAPELIFLGEVDVPTFLPSRAQLAVEIDCASVFERFLDRDEGQRMSNAYMTSVFPGDKGWEAMVSLIVQVPWGQATVGSDTSGAAVIADFITRMRGSATAAR